jgi:hypothetical protein
MLLDFARDALKKSFSSPSIPNMHPSSQRQGLAPVSALSLMAVVLLLLLSLTSLVQVESSSDCDTITFATAITLPPRLPLIPPSSKPES